jgi:hypothetical protein
MAPQSAGYMRWDLLYTASLPARTHIEAHCMAIHAVCVELTLRRVVLIGELLPGSRCSPCMLCSAAQLLPHLLAIVKIGQCVSYSPCAMPHQ